MAEATSLLDQEQAAFDAEKSESETLQWSFRKRILDRLLHVWSVLVFFLQLGRVRGPPTGDQRLGGIAKAIEKGIAVCGDDLKSRLPKESPWSNEAG